MNRRWLPLLLISLLLTACAGQGAALAVYDPQSEAVSPSAQASGSPRPPELTVAAAADLQFAFGEIAARFEAQTGKRVTLVFGSTGQLTQQIENGAPYDLLAAANIAYVRQLAQQGLTRPGSEALYARGRIVLAANRQAGLHLSGLDGLLDPRVQHIAIANPEHAPYGVAAKQALQAAGLWEALQPKLVLAENVRQALQYVQTGDAQAGIIALSVANAPEIEWTLIDDALHQPLDQALAIIAASPNAELAAQFVAFVNGPQGRPIMRRYGFILPGEAPFPTLEPTP
jgi:molybdate transport system substrate-binding protein